MNVLNRPLFRQAGGPAQPVAQDVGQEIQRVATQLDYLNTMASVEPNLAKKEQAILAIQNLAQTTPPEIFRAAQKLVQDTKASKNPNVMVNPNMDPGNQSFVSPVNRANGGEMMAPPMPPPMAAEQMMAAAPPPPPPEVEMLAQAEAGATAQGQELGAAYAQQMMAGIDGAQSTEDLINALRGNDKPLDARREELAGYVGQDDANQTPESVLAMVQPVIMMTEEGMMDSGIGALVQQITGDVEMTTADGAPTDMGMGVGSLMAAGAQEAPAPQNFRQGGAVQRFQTGGAATSFMSLLDNDFDFGSEVKTQYETLMPLFQSIVDSDARAAEAEERKKMDEAQTLFSVARGGLRYAAGDPQAGGSAASQFAKAFEPTAAEIAALGAQAQERKDTVRAQDQQLRLAALQAGIGQAGAEQAIQAKTNLAVLDASLSGTTTVDDVIVKMPDGTTKVFDLKRQLPQYRAAIESGGFVTEGKEESPYGSGTRGQALERLSTPEGVQGAILGLLGERSQEAMLGLSDLAEIQEFSEQTGEATSVVPTHLQPFVRLINDPAALRTFQENNADTKQMFMKDMEAMATDIANGSKDPSELYDFIDSRIATAANIDMESGTGLPSGFWSLVEGSAQQFSDIFNLNIGDGLSDSDQARRMLSSVMQSVDRYVAGAPDESRLLQQQYERLVEQLPQASMFETDASAKEGLKNYRDLVDSDISILKNTIEEAQLYRPGTLDRTRRRLMQAYNLRSLLNGLYENYAGGASGANIPTDVGSFLKTSPSLQTPSFDMSKYYQRTGG